MRHFAGLFMYSEAKKGETYFQTRTIVNTMKRPRSIQKKLDCYDNYWAHGCRARHGFEIHAINVNVNGFFFFW